MIANFSGGAHTWNSSLSQNGDTRCFVTPTPVFYRNPSLHEVSRLLDRCHGLSLEISLYFG